MRTAYPQPLPSDVPRWDHQALRDYVAIHWPNGVSNAAIAAHFGIAESFLVKLIHGKRQPSLHTYAAMLATAGLPLGHFMRGLSRTSTSAK